MSNFSQNYEFSGKTKSALFSRSLSVHTASPATDRPGSIKGKVRMLCDMFESTARSRKSTAQSSIRLPGTEDRIVVFLTSLRGVRKTYDDCYAVRTIFRGFRVRIDERDVSMDSGYRKELQGVFGNKRVSLPQVFIRGKLIGGADVIKQLFEIGELSKYLQGFPVRKAGFECDACGDVRFVPCINCSGSRKVFDEDEEFPKKCPECNENGLIHCPDCSSDFASAVIEL